MQVGIERNIDNILAENDRRNARLFAKYDPLTGENSLLPRMPLALSKSSNIYLPTYLYYTDVIQEIVKAGSLEDYARQISLPLRDLIDWLNQLRLKFDFEFWAATCVKIKDKTSGKEMPFILRQPQQKLLSLLSADLFAGVPVRVIVLKARQWGGSTLIDLWEAWIQIFHRENWNSVIVAHQKDAARNIRSMYNLMAKRHPTEIQEITLKNFEGSQSNKILVERGCVISIGSVKAPDALRSSDIKLVHASEVGLWGDNQKIKGDDLAQAIIASVPNIPFSAIVLESTAKGIGNYFHRTWKGAEEGKNGFKPCFVAWFEIDMYWLSFNSEEEKRKFACSLSTEEWERWDLGATLEGLNWYRYELRVMQSEYRMKQEFPSTPQEAFATTGRYVHSPADIDFMRKGCKEPKYIGTMMGTKPYGKEAIDESLRFVPNPQYNLFLWAMPDKEKDVMHRYIISMDMGGRSDSADWSVISVIDRYPLLFGGVEECIGTWRFHLDQDLSVWRAVQLAKFFNNALLVVERNSLDTKGTEGDHSYTILDQIVPYYNNIYYRDDPTKIREGLPPNYGFLTTRATKMDLISHMQMRLREKAYIERDKRALDECAWFEQKEQGDIYGAIDGEHDDIYMSRAIGLKVSSVWDMPREIEHIPIEMRGNNIFTTKAII